MPRLGKEFGERSNDDIIREILREHASRENPIGRKEIIKHVIEMGYVDEENKPKIKRDAIKGFADRMGARVYETEEECDEIIRECRVTEREIIFIKKGQKGRTIGYWMMETLSDTEWMFLMDSVLNSKILTKKEADNLANRITFLAGKRFSDLTNYRHRMGNQPYFVGDDDIDEKVGYIESRVLQQVRLIRQAIKQGKKIKFNLCVYDYGNQKVRLVPYGRHGKVLTETSEKYKEDVHRICSPFDIIFSNGRYYMLGADLETERRTDLKYKLCDSYDNGFGDEAINTIVQEMENHRDDVIVIFAGYPEPMQQFLDRNPGMRSRIAFSVEFDDYSVEELCEITKLMLSRKQMTITEAGMKKLKKNFESVKDSRDYGNGRFARKMLEEAEMNLAERICQMDETEITTEVLTTIEESDIPDVPLEERRQIKKIGFAC